LRGDWAPDEAGVYNKSYRSGVREEFPGLPYTLPRGRGFHQKALADSNVFPTRGPWGNATYMGAINPFAAQFSGLIEAMGILQPNLQHGSTGYGRRRFLRMPATWKGGQQDAGRLGLGAEITDCPRPIAIPNAVAIIGRRSYGGYATLAWVAFNSDLYAPAVDHRGGRSNLINQLLDSIPRAYWESIRKMFYKRRETRAILKAKPPMMAESPLNPPTNQDASVGLLPLQGAQ